METSMDEKVFIVHVCGEAFDDIGIAFDHMVECPEESHEFTMMVESEAL